MSFKGYFLPSKFDVTKQQYCSNQVSTKKYFIQSRLLKNKLNQRVLHCKQAHCNHDQDNPFGIIISCHKSDRITVLAKAQ